MQKAECERGLNCGICTEQERVGLGHRCAVIALSLIFYLLLSLVLYIIKTDQDTFLKRTRENKGERKGEGVKRSIHSSFCVLNKIRDCVTVDERSC